MVAQHTQDSVETEAILNFLTNAVEDYVLV